MQQTNLAMTGSNAPDATQHGSAAASVATNAAPPSPASTAALSAKEQSVIKGLTTKLSMPEPTIESMTIAMVNESSGENEKIDYIPPSIVAKYMNAATKNIYGRKVTKSELMEVLDEFNGPDGKPMDTGEVADAADEGLKSLNDNEKGDGQSEFSSLAHSASDASASLRHPIEALGNGNPLPALVDAGVVVGVGALAIASLPADAVVAAGAGVVAGIGSLFAAI